jgi:hemerythrin
MSHHSKFMSALSDQTQPELMASPAGGRGEKIWRSETKEAPVTGGTTWSERFLVGIEPIDKQHKALFDYMDGLEQSFRCPDEKQRWSAIHYAIVPLREYAHIHFSVEESLMEILEYPGRTAHVADHRQFLSFLTDLEHRSIIQKSIAQNEVLEFLSGWLLNHIAISDKEYSAHFFSARHSGHDAPVWQEDLPA